LPANADKRPNNYKPKNHESSDEAGAVGIETLLGNVDVDLIDAMNQDAGSGDVILDTLPE
jgi:hypothetical protein